MDQTEIAKVMSLATVLAERKLLIERLQTLRNLIAETKSQQDIKEPTVTVLLIGVANQLVEVPASVRDVLVAFLDELVEHAKDWLIDLPLENALETGKVVHDGRERPYPWLSFEETLKALESATGFEQVDRAMQSALPSGGVPNEQPRLLKHT